VLRERHARWCFVCTSLARRAGQGGEAMRPCGALPRRAKGKATHRRLLHGIAGAPGVAAAVQRWAIVRGDNAV
jgi:hypothetical protein